MIDRLARVCDRTEQQLTRSEGLSTLEMDNGNQSSSSGSRLPVGKQDSTDSTTTSKSDRSVTNGSAISRLRTSDSAKKETKTGDKKKGKKQKEETHLVKVNNKSDKRAGPKTSGAKSMAQDAESSCNSSNERNRSDSNELKSEDSDRLRLDSEPPMNINLKTTHGLQNEPKLSSTKLIRRDDSWQSLMSLTRVGKVKPVPLQVAQRSLYAQYIMPDQSFQDVQYNRHNKINIESTVTPSRVPSLRQKSIQESSQRKLRPFQLSSQHTASFDSQPKFQLSANQTGISSYQKLLQLQLLHNSNNVDYIRHNNGDDYQIYGSESSGNPYGYSSMRSNLKSATSEFSFIRPSPSNHTQTTLPLSQDPSLMIENQIAHPSARSSFILSNKAFSIKESDSNNNNIVSSSPKSARQQKQQFLSDTLNAEINHRSFVSPNGLVTTSSEPPLRELPLKPNKKRSQQENNNVNGVKHVKGSSLTSRIANFFRRTIFRRSRRSSKKRSKLAESCSSSLGRFEECFSGNIPITPSAFSTGSKSVDGRRDLNNQLVIQPQRMVDMIEAFTKQTLSSSDAINSTTLLETAQDVSNCSPMLNSEPSVTPKNHAKLHSYHFGSPIHKSNSISATMGISLADGYNQRALLLNNKMPPGDGSPMMLRSTKVMSANLTSLLSQSGEQDGDAVHRQFSPSWMARSSRPGHHLPRPSSIYGQPSMIASPVISREERNNFGVHRNSLHNHHFRDTRNQNSPGFVVETRRQQMSKMPYLDTTREVAEELLSPTADSENADFKLSNPHNTCRLSQMESNVHGEYLMKKPNFDVISSSPSSGRLQSNRHATVNPIFQSPTMDTIYDNHLVMNEVQSYSHYDNHNQVLMSAHANLQQSPLGLSRVVNSKTQIFRTSDGTEGLYTRHRSNGWKLSNQSKSLVGEPERSTITDDVMIGKKPKPSAIVAPSTPNHNSANYFEVDMSPVSGNRNYRPSSVFPQLRSPIVSRRAVAQQAHYQQSPLVSLQTRVMNKGDGVQATIIGDRNSVNSHIGQSVVKIAGAPGINLEPSLAASLLKGTNIDAYESSSFDRFDSSDTKPNLKTFLVSTRLSKSLAHNQAHSNDDCSTSSLNRDEKRNALKNCDNKPIMDSSKEELSAYITSK